MGGGAVWLPPPHERPPPPPLLEAGRLECKGRAPLLLLCLWIIAILRSSERATALLPADAISALFHPPSLPPFQASEKAQLPTEGKRRGREGGKEAFNDPAMEQARKKSGKRTGEEKTQSGDRREGYYGNNRKDRAPPTNTLSSASSACSVPPF